MATIDCARCGATTTQMAEPPMGGELGETVQRSVCPDCWGEWRETSRLLINHHGINLGDPGQRQQLREAMKQFLNLSPS